MIHFVKHQEIDKAKWDACMEKSLQATIYGYSYYLDSVCEQWDALIEDDYIAIMPLPFRKKMGITYIFPPSMTQQLGVFSSQLISESKVQEFLDAIPSKFKFCRINMNHGNMLNGGNHTTNTHTNLELSLNKPYEELYGLFSENTQRNIKKAAKFNLSIHKDGNVSNLIQLFKENKAQDLDVLPADFYTCLVKAYKMLSEKNQAEIWEVRQNGALYAGAFFGYAKDKVYFLFSASSKEAKEVGAMPFLLHNLIQENASKNIILDFEGSDSPSLARFYRSFGALYRNYNQIILNRLPNIIRSFVKILKYDKKNM